MITGGTRIVSSHDSQITFDWKKPQHPVDLPGSWVNVNSRLGVIMVAGAGITYAQASGYSPGIAVYSDILYGSCSDQIRQFKAGEQVAHRVAIFFTEVTPEEILALARFCSIEETSGGQILHFKQPGSKRAAVPLLSDKQ